MKNYKAFRLKEKDFFLLTRRLLRLIKIRTQQQHEPRLQTKQQTLRTKPKQQT
jgi:hypothetical protein